MVRETVLYVAKNVHIKGKSIYIQEKNQGEAFNNQGGNIHIQGEKIYLELKYYY